MTALVDPAGREYVSWTFSDLPADYGNAEVLLGGTWYPLEWVGTAGSTTRDARILIAGPDYDNSDGLGTVLPRGRYAPKIRLVDTPEVVIRQAGELNIV